MPLPSEKKSGLSLAKVAAIVDLQAIREAPARIAALDDSLDVLQDRFQMHLKDNVDAWEVHAGFPIRSSHPTIGSELDK